MNGNNTLYLECYSGISGDMAVAAMLDLGADRDILKNALESLNVDGFRTEITNVTKSGLRACDFNVILDHDNHDHDSEYLYGSKEHEHHHDHRHLNDILSIISSAKITDNAKKLATEIFNIIAVSESKVHGVPLEEVHFHEVGAVDSIVDIISFAVCFDNLNIKDVIIPELYEGKGSIRCQHGILPIPVPAVSNIVSEHGISLHIMDAEGEYVTPTGAAIVAAICTSKHLPNDFKIEKIGLGAGKRKTERSGLLRAMLISSSVTDNDCIFKLECNIDDCSGEAFGYALDRLMASGAKDVHYTPVFMKKNRPAYMLTVICKENMITEMENIIFQETTTIGIRRVRMERTVLKREVISVKTVFGDVDVKICETPSGKRFYPEYRDIVDICKREGLPYQTVYREIQSQCVLGFKN